VLLDLFLPTMSGEKFLRTLRREETLRMLPVVVFTMSRRKADVRRSYRAGANCYMVKPERRGALAAAVREFLKFWLVWARLPEGE
jgi:DNA-binding NarL/FixJ family response regulator